MKAISMSFGTLEPRFVHASLGLSKFFMASRKIGCALSIIEEKPTSVFGSNTLNPVNELK